MVATAQVQSLLVPFRGLRSFSKDESELFFGREGQSDELAKKLGETRFVAVVGTSGSGKSSLVRAGLLPCLDSGCLVKAGSDWRVVDMRPGGRPIDHLAAALDRAKISEAPVDPERLRNSSLALVGIAQSAYSAQRLQHDENLLILVDQFEELFRYKSQDDSMQDRDEKAAFVKLLLEASRQRDLPVYVAITMRSEFLGDCARFRDLPEAINAGQYLIPRMSREQRRQAIEGPIRMAGGAITPRLVQRILNEVGEDPGQLPVMQHALLRTWIHWKHENQPQRPLDFEDYEAVGALDKAVSNHADEVYDEARSKIPARGDTIMRRLFQRLSDRDQYGRETRRPTAIEELAEVCEAPFLEIQTVVECYRREGCNFLSTPDEQLTPSTEVDVTHECLLTKWDRLSKDWNPEEDESRRAYLRISTRAQESVIDRDAGAEASLSSPVHFRDYLTGAGLNRSLAWWNQRGPNAAWARRYDAQFQLAHRYLLESKKHALTARYLRFMSVLSLAGLAVILCAVWIYRQKAKVATATAEVATAKELFMEAELAFNAIPKDDPREGAFRAAESLRHHTTLGAQITLSQALLQLPQSLQTIQGRRAVDAAFSPGGSWLAVAGDGGVDLYDAKNGTKSRSFKFEGRPTKLLFPSDQFFLVAVDTKIIIWQQIEGDWKHPHSDLECASTVNSFAVDRVGTLLVAECGDLHLWTPDSTKSVPREDDCPVMSAVALSSDGSRVAYVCPTDQGWTIRSREVKRDARSSHRGDITALSSPNVLVRYEKSAKSSVSADKGGSSGQSRRARNDSAEIWSSPKEVRDIRFDPIRAEVLLVAGADGSVRSCSRHTSKQSTASTSQPGPQDATVKPGAEASSTVLHRSAEGYNSLTLPASAEIISFSEDGKWIAVAYSDRVAKVWNASEVSPELPIAHLTLERNMKSIAVSHTGLHLAAVTDDGLVHLWKLDAKRRDFSDTSRLQAHGSYVITSDEKYQRSEIIDARSGATVDRFPDYSAGADPWYRPLTISQDGTFIAGLVKDAVVVNEFRGGKIGKRTWQSSFPKSVYYPTTFGFSLDDHYLIGALADPASGVPDKILLAAWDLSKPDVPATHIPGGFGDSYDFLTGKPQVYIANLKSGVRMYDMATNRSMPVGWGQSFATVGFTPDGWGIGVEMEKSCVPPEIHRQGRTGQAAGLEQTSGSLVRIVNPADGRERTHFEIGNYCVQNFEVSRDSRYLLTIASTPADLDRATVLQLWDLASTPPTQKAEIRNAAPILDAGITPDLNITLLDRKRFAVTPWQTEDLRREFCSRLTPNESEKKIYNQLCSGAAQPPTW